MRLLKLISLFSICAASVFGQETCARWLAGSWKSNRELTLPTLHFKAEVTPALRATAENLFGRLIITFTATELQEYMPPTGDKPEWRYATAYSIVVASATQLQIKHIDPITGQEDIQMMTFESADRYWVALSKLGGREYFDRIPVGEDQPRPNQTPHPTPL